MMSITETDQSSKNTQIKSKINFVHAVSFTLIGAFMTVSLIAGINKYSENNANSFKDVKQTAQSAVTRP